MPGRKVARCLAGRDHGLASLIPELSEGDRKNLSRDGSGRRGLACHGIGRKVAELLRKVDHAADVGHEVGACQNSMSGRVQAVATDSLRGIRSLTSSLMTTTRAAG